MSFQDAEKMHDSIMNSIEFITDLDYLEYSNTREYLDMSNKVYQFCLAYKQAIWTEDDDT